MREGVDDVERVDDVEMMTVGIWDTRELHNNTTVIYR